MNFIWTQIRHIYLSLLSTSKKQRCACVKRRKNVVKSHKVIFQKSQKLLTENLHRKPLFRTFNSYSINFNGGLCNRHTGFCPCWNPCPGGEQFLWYFIFNDLLRFHCILLLFDSSKRLFCEMCLVRSIIEWVGESLQSDWSITVWEFFTDGTRYRDSENDINDTPFVYAVCEGQHGGSRQSSQTRTFVSAFYLKENSWIA